MKPLHCGKRPGVSPRVKIVIKYSVEDIWKVKCMTHDAGYLVFNSLVWDTECFPMLGI